MSKAKKSHERPESVLKNMERIYPFHTTLNSKIGILESNGKKYILKERYEEGLQREYRWLQFLRKKGFVHSPRALGIVRVDGKKAILQEFIEGLPIEQDKKWFYRHADKIASLLARLHRLTRRSQHTAHSFLAEQLHATQTICHTVQTVSGLLNKRDLLSSVQKGKQYLSFLAKAIETRKTGQQYLVARSLVNNEMEFILARNDKIYLIDWENASYGDTAYDIAELSSVYPDMDFPSFLSAFPRTAGSPDDMVSRVNVYLPLIIIKEIFYDILNHATSEVYRNLPTKIVDLLFQARLKDRLTWLDRLCHKL